VHTMHNATSHLARELGGSRVQRAVFSEIHLSLRMCACRDRGQPSPGPRLHGHDTLQHARVSPAPTAPGLDFDGRSKEPEATASHLLAHPPGMDPSDHDFPPRSGALPTMPPVEAFPSARYDAALESMRAASTVEEVMAALEGCRALLLDWGGSHRRWVQ
jgi:hypothetical protein